MRNKRKPVAPRRPGLGARVRQAFLRGEAGLERRVASARTIAGAAYWAIVLFLFLLAGAALRNVLTWPRLARRLAGSLLRKSFGRTIRVRNRLRLRSQPGSDGPRDTLAARLWRTMEENEASLLGRMIEARTDVEAWYSPTAYWPSFHEIALPRLMCVPDVVLNDFPTGFSVLGGTGVEKSFDKLETAIDHGEYFVTYSERVKWETLVRRYGANPESVFVVRHGANRLDDLIRVNGFPDNAAATDRLCRRLLATALQKDVHRTYEGVRLSTGIRFIFYASQFRPNKNIISLLRAYDYLLRRRFVGHKLILTGIPVEADEVSTFIANNNLQQDVLCLHSLNEQELAACYHLADLAVNPSLSEGGCPFTYTEAMSVGTPVVMARIPVTEEVITDSKLQAAMLFDPFDWRDMAERIEYGLRNRDQLRVLQQPFYEQLARRSWRNVVDDYVAILSSISTRTEGLHAGV
jgi:glycosyltransferase involved in cell wall biosynthesis